jgi:hypothetical protein
VSLTAPSLSPRATLPAIMATIAGLILTVAIVDTVTE